MSWVGWGKKSALVKSWREAFREQLKAQKIPVPMTWQDHNHLHIAERWFQAGYEAGAAGHEKLIELVESALDWLNDA